MVRLTLSQNKECSIYDILFYNFIFWYQCKIKSILHNSCCRYRAKVAVLIANKTGITTIWQHTPITEQTDTKIPPTQPLFLKSLQFRMTLEKEGSQGEHKPTPTTSLPKLHGHNQNSSDPARLAPGAARLTDRHTDRLAAEASWALSGTPDRLGSHPAVGRPARPELKGSLCFPASQAGAALLLPLPKFTKLSAAPRRTETNCSFCSC